MTPDFFYNLNHARSYLTNSVIKIDGQASYIINVDYVKKYRIYYIPSFNPEGKKEQTIFLEDAAVDLTPPELGFINKKRLDTTVSFCILRKPIRAWKIGLTEQNIITLKNTKMYNILLSKGLFDLVNNNFPKLDTCIKLVKENNHTKIAFHKRYAINKTRLFYYLKEEPVGTLTENKINLYDSFQYLKEDLDEAMNESY